MKRSMTLFAAGVGAAALVAAPLTVSAQEESIADIAAGAGDFETLLTAAGLAGLDGLLADCEAGPFTVLAPTDDAFAALPADVLDAALADPEGLLTTVLTYHVVPGAALAADVTAATSLTTVQGEAISVDGTVLNGSVNIVATDLEACNGVVHVIDAVLLPPSITDAAAEEPAAEAPAEDLPATGVDNQTAGVVAGSLLAAGVAMVALVGVGRRRSTV